MKRIATRSLISTLGACLALQAGAAQAAVAHICPELDRNAKTLSVRVGSGCMTGMARFKAHDLQLTVTQERAHIQVTGDIRFHPIRSKVVTADCGGAQSVTLTAEGIEPRRYTLSYGDDLLGEVDFLERGDPPRCLGTSRNKAHFAAETLNRQNFKAWANDPDAQWSAWRGSTVTELLEPILGDHPESLEGRPSIVMRLEKRMWQSAVRSIHNVSREPFIAVWITRDGIADDSISADRFFVAVRQADDGWRVNELWSQQMCARGKYAGQWTSAPCA